MILRFTEIQNDLDGCIERFADYMVEKGLFYYDNRETAVHLAAYTLREYAVLGISMDTNISQHFYRSELIKKVPLEELATKYNAVELELVSGGLKHKLLSIDPTCIKSVFGDSNKVTATIDKVRFTGKWVEIWFKEGDILQNNFNSYHVSSKIYRFWAAIGDDAYDDVISNGVSVRTITLEKIGPNYEILSIK